MENDAWGPVSIVFTHPKQGVSPISRQDHHNTVKK